MSVTKTRTVKVPVDDDYTVTVKGEDHDGKLDYLELVLSGPDYAEPQRVTIGELENIKAVARAIVSLLPANARERVTQPKPRRASTIRVVTKRTATIVLGDNTPLQVEAEYEPDGTLNCLLLKQRTEDGEQDMVVVAELDDVARLVKAIGAVVLDADATTKGGAA